MTKKRSRIADAMRADAETIAKAEHNLMTRHKILHRWFAFIRNASETHMGTDDGDILYKGFAVSSYRVDCVIADVKAKIFDRDRKIEKGKVI